MKPQAKPSILGRFICICYLKIVQDSFAGDVHHRYIPVTLLFYFSARKAAITLRWRPKARPIRP